MDSVIEALDDHMYWALASDVPPEVSVLFEPLGRVDTPTHIRYSLEDELEEPTDV